MEELYADLLLWLLGFQPKERYTLLLDEYFSNNSDSIYFQLEECASNLMDTMGRFQRYWDYECPTMDADFLGKRLFSGLKEAYDANIFDLKEFGKRCNLLWKSLPFEIAKNEPFHTLIYADEPLCWGDEKHSRWLYETAFSFYDKT